MSGKDITHIHHVVAEFLEVLDQLVLRDAGEVHLDVVLVHVHGILGGGLGDDECLKMIIFFQ